MVTAFDKNNRDHLCTFCRAIFLFIEEASERERLSFAEDDMTVVYDDDGQNPRPISRREMSALMMGRWRQSVETTLTTGTLRDVSSVVQNMRSFTREFDQGMRDQANAILAHEFGAGAPTV